ncbi:MAG: NifU family protein [Sandaracinus sp.]
MSRRTDIERAIDEILRPLLAVDGGGVDVVEIADDGSRVALALTGTLRGDPSAEIVKERVIAPLVRRAAAGEVEVTYVLGPT